MARILITGAGGFAGAHIVEEALTYEDTTVVALDCLTYAGSLDRLAHLPRERVQFVYHDFSGALSDALLKQIGPVDYIIHNGAESHVLRSFQNPGTFVESNIIGTLNMLEAARRLKPTRFLYVSTDEVFGAADNQELFKEDDVLAPTNPYAATKASGEFLAYSYFRSFGLPVIISRTMNMFGERQHPEKFVPKVIGQILRGETVKIHGTLVSVLPDVWESGTRRWLHARTQANALLFLLAHGNAGEKYNIAGVEKSNLEVERLIAGYLGAEGLWEFTDPQGPIHDMHYALDDRKIRAMGWAPPLDFEESLKRTVLWSAENQEWLCE